MIFYTIKKAIIVLLIYTLFVLIVAYSGNALILENTFKLTPYNYSIVFNVSEYKNKIHLDVYEKKRLLSILKSAEYSSRLDPEYWNNLLSINYKLGDKKNYEFFYNSLILTKNNKDINRYLKNFFIRNYSDFSPDERRRIISEF
jgi:hypothetical protein